MKINTLGINYTHENGLVIDRPEGSGDYLLIIFKTRGFVTFGDKTSDVMPDSAVLFKKGTHQLYGNKNERFVNHCIHMTIDDNDDILSRAGLAADTVFSLENPDKTEEKMREISRELYSGKSSAEELSQLYLRCLLYHLGENCTAFLNGNQSLNKGCHSSELQALRAEIYSSPGKNISVKSMAEKLNISVPHFQRLYKEHFSVSSYEDVIHARIRLAKHCLRTTDMPVSEIADVCGYENYEHFIRQFRIKTGCTPTEYRNGRD